MCVLVSIYLLDKIVLTNAHKFKHTRKGKMNMSKDFGVKLYLFPMPTYMIATYYKEDSIDVMMTTWGGICAEDMVALNLEEDHKTVTNLKTRKVFSLAIPGTDTLEQSDFLGIASANKFTDKFERTKLHATKSNRVDAPIISKYPLTLECEVIDMQEQPYGLRVLGKIVNVLANDNVLDEAGKIDAKKLNAFIFDQMQNGYYAIGEKSAKHEIAEKIY